MKEKIIPMIKKLREGEKEIQIGADLGNWEVMSDFETSGLGIRKISGVLNRIFQKRGFCGDRPDGKNIAPNKVKLDVLGCEPLSGVPCYASKEWYSLKIKDKGLKRIVISASEAQGAFYGVVTLAELLSAFDGKVKELEITDWPDLKMRGVHMTLGSGNMPRFERLKILIEKMSELKFNTFIIEYDDRFPWEKHPDIVNRNALTKPQIRELISFAEENYIEVIPLLDSLGHAEHYLKHEKYSYLRELPDRINEMCASRPETMKFIKELWNEVLELHKNCKFVHITGDEVFRMGGFCPECRKYAEGGRLSELYLKYYSELCAWMKEQGKTPVIWSDMLEKYPEQIEKFPHYAYVHVWAYYGIDSDVWPFRMRYAGTYGDDPEKRKKKLEPYWETGNPGEYKTYPFLKFFKDYGFKTLGASAVGREADTRYPVSGFFPRFANNKRFASAALKDNSEGLIGTFWSGSGTIEAAWAGITACADYSWYVREEDFDVFMKRLSYTFLNSENGASLLEAVDKRLYRNSLGFQPVSTDIPSKPLLDGLLKNASVCPSADKYIRIIKLADELADIDIKSEKIINNMRFNEIGNGSDRIISIEEAANSTNNTCMPPDAPPFPIPSAKTFVWRIQFKIDKQKFICVKDDTDAPVRINVNDNFDILCILNTCHSTGEGDVAARMKVVYADGSECEEYKFIGGYNTADWWGEKRPFHALEAWRGITEGESIETVYLTLWRNPYPEKQIQSIVFYHGDRGKRFVILAITGRKTDKSGEEIINTDETATFFNGIEKQYTDIKAEFENLYDTIMAVEDREKAVDKLFGWRLKLVNEIKNKGV